MKRRFANAVEGIYQQKQINEEIFSGYICNIKIKNVQKPLIVNNGISQVCIKDNDYEWFEIYPENSNYAITIMYDNNKNLIEWYFDIAKKVGVENGIPYEDDLYLDMIILPNGKSLIVDEDDLIDAFNAGEIQQDDVNLAYETLKQLKEKYVDDFQHLNELTSFVLNSFSDAKEK